jgi:predicted metalloprotease with PDZ domain
MSEAITCMVRVPRPEWHGIEVEASFPTEGRPEIELMMAVWTPGSYLVREFARHVEEIAATGENGCQLPISKTAKNRWRVPSRGARRVVVRYRLYARELSVRTNFVDSGFALINGAATFLALAGDSHRPYEVRLELPSRWRTAVAALPAAAGGGTGFRAEDFDQLVDSPIYAGNGAVHRFEVGGRPHLLVNEGEEEGSPWDGGRAAAEAERVVRQQLAFWGCLPYPRYVFFNLIAEGSGGLEHRDSSVLMTSRWRTRNREGWLDWIGLLSHELFHAWNAKRLRPAEMDGVDYEREVYTPDLWQVEGITSYYDDLLVHRAGLSTRGEYLRLLGKQLEALETAPGRRVQSLADASVDTWIKFYRRDENFINSGISYYTKGAAVSFLLDALIRRATGGERSLDDVQRLAYQRFSGERGYRSEDLKSTAGEVAGSDLGPWFAAALDSTADLEYGEALDWYGLRFCEPEDSPKSPQAGGAGESPAWLGVDAETEAGRLLVTVVKRGTPAHDAGVNAGDEILAIGDYRVPPAGLRERLKCYRPGEQATLLVARRERLVRLPVTFGAAPRPRFRLEADPAATAEQQRHLDDWLAAGSSPGG